jgi:hypothetical protein
MTERMMNSRDNDKLKEPSDEALASLMKDVDARPRPPVEVEQAVFEHSLAQWRVMQANRNRRKNYRYFAAAAVIVLAVLLKPLMFSGAPDAGVLPALGSVSNLKGVVYVVRDGQREVLDDMTQGLFAGESIITNADAGLSITWSGGSSIRIDQNSALVLNSAAELDLLSGQVYVDVPLLPSGRAAQDLSVSTRFGIVRHIGTQFMVSSQEDAVQVLVREGSVSISNDRETVVTAAGSRVTLDAADTISQESVPAFGAQWQWAEQLAPPFEVEGLPLSEVLERISRETGKPILYDSADAERIATSTIMHGSIDEDPEDAMEIVLQTNDLSWFEKDGKVHLFVSQ